MSGAAKKVTERRPSRMADKLRDSSEIEALIQEVKSREWLWNMNLENYRGRDKDKRKCWREIAAKMGVSVDVVKLKWKNLRDIFRREIKRFGLNEPQNYTGKWRFYEQMWFVQSSVSIPKRRSSNEGYDADDNDNIDEERNDGHHTYIKWEPNPAEDNEKSINAEYFEDNDNDFDGVLHKRPRIEISNDDDYDMMYLKSLLPFFKTLDPMRKLVVRTKIQNMLLSEMTAAEKAKDDD